MFIYVVTNERNGKQYVGQTRQQVMVRWHQHIRSKSPYPFPCAIRKYGKDAFRIETVATTTNQAQLNILEKQFIENLQTLYPAGYNVAPGGAEARKKGSKLSTTHKSRIAQAMKRVVWTAERREKHAQAMKKSWDEDRRRTHRARMRRLWAIGRIPKPSELTRKKCSSGMKKWWKQWARTRRSIAALSITGTGGREERSL